MGPDQPVYLWWARLGAAEGISLVGARPGAPALIPAIAGTLHLPLVPVMAGLQYSLGVAVGAATVALVRGRSRGGRPGWLLSGSMAGMFGVHLAAGYVANLAFAVTFVAAAAMLAGRTRRSVPAAVLLLGGGGLFHPEFFAVGMLILGVTAALAWSVGTERGWSSDAPRIVGSIVGAGAIVAAGLASMALGPSRLPVDTSKDGFLRRAGLAQALRDTYLFRFRENVRRYAPWLTLPLAAIGTLQVRGTTSLFLVAWLVCTVLGVPVGIATGWFPPERLMTFGFAAPILAGLGLTWVWERTEPRRWLTIFVTGVLVLLFLVPTIDAQRAQQTFVSPEDLISGSFAGRIARTLPPGTPLVFAVDDIDTSATFLATHVGNLARATVPTDRVQDVYVFVGRVSDYYLGRPTIKGVADYDALSRITLADLPPGPRALFVVRGYDREPSAFTDSHLREWSEGVWSDVPNPRPLPAGPDEPSGSGPWPIALTTVLVLMLVWVIGAGWARWAFGDRVAAATTAPAFGVAALTISALALDRLGMPLTGAWGPSSASALAGLSGYALSFFKGTASVDPATQVDE